MNTITPKYDKLVAAKDALYKSLAALEEEMGQSFAADIIVQACLEFGIPVCLKPMPPSPK